MRAGSSEGANDFLDELQDLARTHAADVTHTADLHPHFDFQYANILGEDGHVTGVIDWEAARLKVASSFDLAAFAYYVFDDGELQDHLMRRALEISGRGALLVYLAHIMFEAD